MAKSPPRKPAGLLAAFLSALIVSLPFVSAQSQTVSVKDLSRRAVVNNLVSGTCPKQLKPGLLAPPCYRANVGISLGESCLSFKIGEGGAAKIDYLACANSCSPDLRNTDPCSGYPCYRDLIGRAYFRTFAALDSATQQKMAADYTKLLALVRADIANQRSAYTSLGGDAERSRLKFEILGFVIGGYLNHANGEISAPGTMLPYGECLLKEAGAREAIGTPEVSISKLYGQAPQVSTGNPSDASPMDTSANGTLHLYESAFFTCARVTPDLSRCTSGITPASPDSFAGAIIHELVHATQKHFGHESGAGGFNDATSDLKTLLNEIMAYGDARNDLFYLQALSAADLAELTGPGLAAQVRAFQSGWPAAGAKVQEDVAGWAWAIPWMRARMLQANRPAQEGTVWNLTCQALRRKNPIVGDLCGLANVRQ